MTYLYGIEAEAIIDRLEGWELVEFLQVPIEDILEVAMENEWINEENIDDLLDFAGLRKGENDEEESS